MSAAAERYRVPFLPEVWLVPATLADLECRHGELGGCSRCQLEQQPQQETDQALVETAA